MLIVRHYILNLTVKESLVYPNREEKGLPNIIKQTVFKSEKVYQIKLS